MAQSKEKKTPAVKSKQSLFGEFLVQIKLFGLVELKNQSGEIIENRSRQPLPWLLLKYLLVDPLREVDLYELLDTIWPASENGEELNAARVRLRRLRESLEPLNLGGRKGLILYSDGKYSLNPLYEIKTDADEFLKLIKQSQNYENNDPVGLQLCMQALELYRGQYMECTENAVWLDKYRSYYNREFSNLARSIIDRSKTLQVNDLIKLLCQRTSAILPSDEKLHREIISYLMDQKMELELMRHISRLTRSGQADWLEVEV